MAKERKKRKKTSQGRAVLKRLIKDKTAIIGFAILLVIVICAIFAPLLAPYSPNEMDYSAMFATPSLAHPFGCDNLGRDILSRLMYGARYSLSLGLICEMIHTIIGLILGTAIGYAGGRVDLIAMRVLDVWGSLPEILLACIIASVLEPGAVSIIIATSVSGIPRSVRQPRSMALKECSSEYLEAAVSINCSRPRVLYKHMLPNIISPTIVSCTMGVGASITSIAGLAYIGLGIQPPSPEWGAMLSNGKNYMLQYPHMIMFPGLVIAVTVLAINLFGDGLRDALDPKLKH